MIDPSRVQPEFVGDLVWLRGARAVASDTFPTGSAVLIVQVADDGYRITVPIYAIEPVSTVWSVSAPGAGPGSLAVKRSWWDTQVGAAKPSPGEVIADAIVQRNGASTTAAEIVLECDRIEKMLLAKNRAYGNSALDPLRVFSKADAIEQLKVRLDDKLSRLMRGAVANEIEEDTELDLIGYLILLRVARKAVR